MDEDTRLIVELTAEKASTLAVTKHAESCPQTKRIIALENTVNGEGTLSGLKGKIGSLAQKMGLIQWVLGIIIVAVAAAVADRFINKPATNEGLANINNTIQESSDRAARTAAKTAMELIQSNK